MKNKKDEKWLDRMIAQAADFGKVTFDAQQWKQKYLLEKSRETLPSRARLKPQKTIWRFIMESKVTRYSAAAVIILAIALVLLSPFGTPGNGGVVLADVQQKLADIETMVIRGQKTFSRSGDPSGVFEFDGLKCQFDLTRYMSKQYGFTEEGYTEGKLVYRATFNRAKQQTLIVLPLWKKYVVFAYTDDVVKIMEDLTPRGLFNLLLECDYKDLGRDSIDGVEVQRFAFQNADPIKGILPKAVFDIQQGKGEVWIATKELLPIRIEGDVVIGRSLMTVFNELNLHEVNVLDTYNIELDEDIFDTNPPEGYTEITLSDILQVIPAEAKVGLFGVFVIPAAGFIIWKRIRRQKATANQY